MFLLILVSFIWAFSFGLIKGRLAGVDPSAVSVLRLGLALLVFLPFLRWRGAGRNAAALLAIGAVQFGLMYLLYLRAFAHLQAFEVALFTITTPFFVAVFDGALERRVVPRFVLAAGLSVAGAAVIVGRKLASGDLLTGMLLVQASNVCFAVGQVAWRRFRPRLGAEVTDASVFGLMYAGAFALSLFASFATTDWAAVKLDGSQIITLIYLGVLASGLCFFWWNKGATQVNAGTLAVFNNVKIPLTVACSLLFFGEQTPVVPLLIGGALVVAGLWLAEHREKPEL